MAENAKENHDLSFKVTPSSSRNSSFGPSTDSTVSSSFSFESICSSRRSSLDFSIYEAQSQSVSIVENVLNTKEIVDQMNERIEAVSSFLNVSTDRIYF